MIHSPFAERDRQDVRLLRTLVDQLPALIAYWDVDGRNVVANHAYVEFFGLEPERMRGMHISEVLGTEVYAKNLPFITGALAGQEQLFDRTLVDQAGHTRHTQASYVPDVIGGEVHGFFVLVTDVTPRVKAQRAMDEAQALAKLGSWELDVATGVVTWSRNLYRLVGLDPEETGTLTLPAKAVLVHPDDRDRVLSNVEQATRTGRPYAIGYRVLTEAGGEIEVVSQGNPVVDAQGRVTRINGTMQDVTEANAAALDLARVNAELRRANELNADVIAMLGHDIRSPMTAIFGYLELLEQHWGTFEDADRRSYVTKARAAAGRLSAMIERILALAAVDSGRIDPRPQDLDLARALDEIAQESGLPGRPLVDLAPGIARSVSFDPVHLQQIVGNLLTNAFRYGAEPVCVTAREGADRHVEVLVSDAGPGIAESETGALFTRFARTGLRQRAAGGTGFGLYMAAQLARANGATLTYRPRRDDRPHAFVLSIPTVREIAGDEAAVSPS
ncbi:sensor histidine kinase [Nocardioides rubriscoriae]|uniref:sensor histidine kinase n=1 Tax=Nocardioides rubriscoriae TaxID=642762 RepID=UPI0014791ACC|nr:HAMP domain-containing sensor histidine kinase [Nocardioides rubriscoriae]